MLSNIQQKRKDLQDKLNHYEAKLAEKRKGYGDVVRTRFGDSYEDQLRDDTNALEQLIRTIKEEIESLQ